MQTKSSYRVLKWTFIVGTMVSLGACVVTSGDGGDDDDDDFSDAGSSTTAGKSGSTAGTGGKGGSATAGRGGSAGATTTPSAGSAGEGGAVDVYQVGLCDADEPNVNKGILPTMFPSCAAAASDEGQDCKKCLKDKCCDAWQNCYGSEPHIACGWGTTPEADGQWDCIENCIVANETGEATPADLLATCSADCTNQCDAADGGNILVATSDLITCANDPDKCQDVCFPF
jgi:hypothetical protein